jgi:hypothetical protein
MSYDPECCLKCFLTENIDEESFGNFDICLHCFARILGQEQGSGPNICKTGNFTYVLNENQSFGFIKCPCSKNNNLSLGFTISLCHKCGEEQEN